MASAIYLGTHQGCQAVVAQAADSAAQAADAGAEAGFNPALSADAELRAVGRLHADPCTAINAVCCSLLRGCFQIRAGHGAVAAHLAA